MNVYLVRHGQTVFNEQYIHQYSSTPLSEKGKEEVRSMTDQLKEIRVDAFYTSPMKRAQETADIISAVINKKYTLLSSLHEIKRPSIIEGKKNSDEFVTKVKEELQKHYLDRNWHYSDEENYWDVEKRVMSVMDLLIEEQDGNVLLVTHGLFIRMFLALAIFGKDVTPRLFQDIYTRIHISNTGLSECSYLKEFGWKLIRLNDTRHLSST